MPQLRLHISAAVAVGALMLLTASPASADTPPPPGPASLPALTVPGKPTLESTDSRGTNVEIMGGDDRTLLGMPGSRLGNSPYRLSQVGPTTSVRGHIRRGRSRTRQHQPDRRPGRSTRQPCTGSRGGQRRHLCRNPAGTRSGLMAMTKPTNFRCLRGGVQVLSAVIGASVVVGMGAVNVAYPGTDAGASATSPKGWPAATVTRTPPASAPQTSFAAPPVTATPCPKG